MKHDVFISYYSKNVELAKKILKVLEDDGVRCWMAPRDIPPGQDYSAAIPPAVKKSKIIVVLCTKEAYGSPNVKSEIRIAFDNKVRIIPFKADDSKLPEEWEFFLAFSQWLDAHKNPENYLAKLVEAVHRYISGNMSQPPHSSKNLKIISFISAWTIGIICLYFVCMFYNGYARIANCQSVAEMERYKPRNVIESLFWDSKINEQLKDVDSVIESLEGSYKCKINRSITIEKLKVLQDILTNTSFIPDYCPEYDSVYVSKYEVSTREWNTFMNLKSDLDNNTPICNVSIHDINCFLDSLSYYSGLRFYLPTKSEWEFFANAKCDYVFSGSNNPDDVAWYKTTSEGVIHHRGDKNQNTFDIFDMSGNAAEILGQDTLIHSKRYRFIKGGHFNSFQNELKIASYDLLKDGQKDKHIGFRIIIK